MRAATGSPRLPLLAAAPSVAVLALLMITIGLPLSPWLGSLSASVQCAAPPGGASTEAFTWTFTLITVGMAPHQGTELAALRHHTGRRPRL